MPALIAFDETLAYANLDNAIKAGKPWVGFCYTPHYVFGDPLLRVFLRVLLVDHQRIGHGANFIGGQLHVLEQVRHLRVLGLDRLAVVEIKIGGVPGGRGRRLLQPCRIIGRLDNVPLGGVVGRLLQYRLRYSAAGNPAAEYRRRYWAIQPRIFSSFSATHCFAYSSGSFLSITSA